METRGLVTPETEQEAAELYTQVAPVAQTIVRVTATAMGFDQQEYDDRVTPDVIDRAHNAIFASLLEVTVGTRDEFESWLADHDFDSVVVGSDHVDNVAWHAAPFTNTAVATTFHDKEDAAVETLRRQVFGRLYEDVVRRRGSR